MPVFSPLFNLFRWHGNTVADYAPWYRLATYADGQQADGIVTLKKGNGLLRCYTVRGRDWSGETKATQGMRMMAANDALRKLPGEWTLHAESQRVTIEALPELSSPFAIPRFIHRNRVEDMLSGTGTHTTEYILSLTWTPLETVEGERVREFALSTDEFMANLQGVLAEMWACTSAEQLSYLKTTISDIWQPVGLPDEETDLDLYLCDADWDSGDWRQWDSTLGDWHIRVCTLTGYPGRSWAGMMRAIDNLAVPYRLCTRWSKIEDYLQDGILQHRQQNWLAQEYSPLQRLKDASGLFTAMRTPDEAATRKAEDLSEVRQDRDYDIKALGHFSTCLVTWGKETAEADMHLRRIMNELRRLGFIVKQEGKRKDWFPQHTPAWLSTHPGNTEYVLRKTIQTTLTAAHLLPGLQAVWPGPAWNMHLNGPPWLIAQTEQCSLFRVNSHVRDVPHHLAIGQTGVGKSTFMWLLAMMWTQYQQAQIFAYDNGHAGRLPTLLLGGHWYPVGSAQIAFQPLRNIDDPIERGWAVQWLLDLCAEANVQEDGGKVLMALSGALRGLAETTVGQPQRRTLSALLTILANQGRATELNAKRDTRFDGLVDLRNQIRNALKPYTRQGDFGWLLDSDSDSLQDGPIHTFELSGLLKLPRFARAVMQHIHHQLETRMTPEAPTYMPMDEAATVLLLPGNEMTWNDLLMKARKQGVMLGFYIHHLDQLFAHRLGPLMVSSCPTQYLFPNPAAKSTETQKYYERLGLVDEEITTLATARPNRDIYYSCEELGKRLFHLSLSRFCLDMLARNTPADHLLMDNVFQQEGREGFAAGWCRALGYHEVARQIAEEQQTRDNNSTGGVDTLGQYPPAVSATAGL